MLKNKENLTFEAISDLETDIAQYMEKKALELIESGKVTNVSSYESKRFLGMFLSDCEPFLKGDEDGIR